MPNHSSGTAKVPLSPRQIAENLRKKIENVSATTTPKRRLAEGKQLGLSTSTRHAPMARQVEEAEMDALPELHMAPERVLRSRERCHSAGATPFSGVKALGGAGALHVYTQQANAVAAKVIFATDSLLDRLDGDQGDGVSRRCAPPDPRRVSADLFPDINGETKVNPVDSSKHLVGRSRGYTSRQQPIPRPPPSNTTESQGQGGNIFSLTQAGSPTSVGVGSPARPPTNRQRPATAAASTIATKPLPLSEDTSNQNVDGEVATPSAPKDGPPPTEGKRRPSRYWSTTTASTSPRRPATASASLLDRKMYAEHPDLMFGSKYMMSYAHIKARVETKLEYARDTPEINEYIINSATTAKKERIANFRAHDFVHSRVDAAVSAFRQDYLENEIHESPFAYSTSGQRSAFGSSIGVPQSPSPSTLPRSFGSAPPGPKVPAYILEKARHEFRQQALAEQEQVFSRDATVIRNRNELRRVQNAQNVIDVNRAREERVLESVTRHDRIAEEAEAERQRHQHSELKAEWLTLIVHGLIQGRIQKMTLRIVVANSVKHHDDMFRSWFHRWHDPTCIRLIAKKKKLARAKVFMALIITRMWAWIAVRRRKALLVRQHLMGVREAGRMQVAVRKFMKTINQVIGVARRYLTMRQSSLQLVYLQFRRHEKEFLLMRLEDQAEADAKAFEEEEALSKNRAARAAKAKERAERAAMGRDQQLKLRVSDLLSRDRTNYSSEAFHFPLALVAPTLVAEWGAQRKHFLVNVQPKLLADDMQVYNRKLLARASMGPSEMAKTPIPALPARRNAPRLFTPKAMEGIVQKVYDLYEQAMQNQRRAAAVQAVTENMDCNYPLIRDDLVDSVFIPDREARDRFKVAFGDLTSLLKSNKMLAEEEAEEARKRHRAEMIKASNAALMKSLQKGNVRSVKRVPGNSSASLNASYRSMSPYSTSRATSPPDSRPTTTTTTTTKLQRASPTSMSRTFGRLGSRSMSPVNEGPGRISRQGVFNSMSMASFAEGGLLPGQPRGASPLLSAAPTSLTNSGGIRGSTPTVGGGGGGVSGGKEVIDHLSLSGMTDPGFFASISAGTPPPSSRGGKGSWTAKGMPPRRIEAAISEAANIRTDVLEGGGSDDEEGDVEEFDEVPFSGLDANEAARRPPLMPSSFTNILQSISASTDRTAYLLAETQRLRSQLYTDLQQDQVHSTAAETSELYDPADDSDDHDHGADKDKCPPCDEYTISKLYRLAAPPLAKQRDLAQHRFYSPERETPSVLAVTSSIRRALTRSPAKNVSRSHPDVCPICCEIMASRTAATMTVEATKSSTVDFDLAKSGVVGGAWRAPSRRRPQSASALQLSKSRPTSAVGPNALNQTVPTPNLPPTNKVIIRLICSHTFCETCLVQWLRINGSCPTCRKIVTYEDYPTLYRHQGTKKRSIATSVATSSRYSSSGEMGSSLSSRGEQLSKLRPPSASGASIGMASSVSRPSSATLQQQQQQQGSTTRPASARAQGSKVIHNALPMDEGIRDYGDDGIDGEEDPFLLKGTNTPSVRNTDVSDGASNVTVSRPAHSALRARLPPRPSSALGKGIVAPTPLPSSAKVSTSNGGSSQPCPTVASQRPHSALFSFPMSLGKVAASNSVTHQRGILNMTDIRPSSASVRVARPMSCSGTSPLKRLQVTTSLQTTTNAPASPAALQKGPTVWGISVGMRCALPSSKSLTSYVQ